MVDRELSLRVGAEMQEAHRRQRMHDARTSEAAYIEMLGMQKFPQSPSELPGIIHLPPEIIGDFEREIVAQGNGLRESSQLIRKAGSRGFRPGVVHRSHVDLHTSLVGEAHHNFLQSRFFNNPMTILHTHTGDSKFEDFIFFSMMDVALHTSRSSPAMIDLVGSPRGIFAVLLTREFQRYNNSTQARKDLLNKRGWDYQNWSRIGILEDIGLGAYGFFGKTEKGDLRDGLTLRRLDVNGAFCVHKGISPVHPVDLNKAH